MKDIIQKIQRNQNMIRKIGKALFGLDTVKAIGSRCIDPIVKTCKVSIDWILKALIVVGAASVINFIRVNYYGERLVLKLGETPVFTYIVRNEALDEYLDVMQDKSK